MRKKINPEGRLYRERAKELALTYCPNIYPCKHCGNPVRKGYCCGYCESDNPC